DQSGSAWRRADYSCMGPGRSPGLVKPDGLAFGGSTSEPFMVLSGTAPGTAEGLNGTSFAAPFVLRSATSINAQVGQVIGPLAIRGLLIHRAEQGSHPQTEVGWGRFETDPLRLITCDDCEALVVFQGNLPITDHLRVPVPLPKEPLKGKVTISATLVI